MEETVNYLDSDYTVKLRPVPHRGILGLAPGQSATGYGSKISTDYMLKIAGTTNRLYRVYAVCYSNSASFYVIVKGQCQYLRTGQFEDKRESATLHYAK